MINDYDDCDDWYNDDDKNYKNDNDDEYTIDNNVMSIHYVDDDDENNMTDFVIVDYN